MVWQNFKSTPRFVTAFFGLLLFFGSFTVLAEVQAQVTDPEDVEIEIVRDQYGVPHIYADSNFGVYFGFGYALATDRLFQLDMMRRSTTGRVAQVLGSEYSEFDAYTRSNFDWQSVALQYSGAGSNSRALLRAFSRGINKRIAEVTKKKSKLLPQEYTDFDFLPERWTELDVVKLFVGVVFHRYSGISSELDNLLVLKRLAQRNGTAEAINIFNASKWILDIAAPNITSAGEVEQRPTPSASEQYNALLNSSARPVGDPRERFGPRSAGDNRELIVETAIESKGEDLNDTEGLSDSDRSRLSVNAGTDSSLEESSLTQAFYPFENVWAFNKGIDDVKGALIYGAQFDFSYPTLTYSVGLHGGDFNIVGSTIVGLPMLLRGHNGGLAWSLKAGLGDQVDVYVEKTSISDADAYTHNGVSRLFKTWIENIVVRDGKDFQITAKKTTHGMVTHVDAENEIAYSKARSWEGTEFQSLQAMIDLTRQTTYEGAIVRLGRIGADLNFYLMDLNGDIHFAKSGQFPERAEQHDSRFPVEGTGAYDWRGYKSFTYNPKESNPSGGFFTDWNSRPRSDWIGSDLWFHSWDRLDKAQLVLQKLANKNEWTVDEIWSENQSISARDAVSNHFLPILKSSWVGEDQSDLVKAGLSELSKGPLYWVANEEGNYAAGTYIFMDWLNELMRMVVEDDVGLDIYKQYYLAPSGKENTNYSQRLPMAARVILRNIDSLIWDEKPAHDFFNGKDFRVLIRGAFTTTMTKLSETEGENVATWQTKVKKSDLSGFDYIGIPMTSSVVAKSSVESDLGRGGYSQMITTDGKSFSAYEIMSSGQSADIQGDGELNKHYFDQASLFKTNQYKVLPFTIPSDGKNQGFTTTVINTDIK